MVDAKELNRRLVAAWHKDRMLQPNDKTEIFELLKQNPSVFDEAVEIEKDKYGDDTVRYLALCDVLLTSKELASLNIDAYNRLVHSIYTNKDIARSYFGALNLYREAFSFLLETLWNYDLKLTDEQKSFAVDEAMNKRGTTRNPKGFDFIGLKDSKSQIHGIGVFDIRYAILTNPNWTIDEKEKLTSEFYSDVEQLKYNLNEWELDVINTQANVEKYNPVTTYGLYNYTYDDLKNIFNNENDLNEMWQGISFCRMIKSFITKEKTDGDVPKVKVKNTESN